MASKKLKHEIECPYCHKTMGKQGIYGHIRGNHKGMEDDYRSRFPPKMTSLKSQHEPKEEIKSEPDPDPIEEIMNEEPKEQPAIEEKKPEPEPVKETPAPEVKPEGEKSPSKKGGSFLDWLFGGNEEPKDKSEKDDDWW